MYYYYSQLHIKKKLLYIYDIFHWFVSMRLSALHPSTCVQRIRRALTRGHDTPLRALPATLSGACAQWHAVARSRAEHTVYIHRPEQ